MNVKFSSWELLRVFLVVFLTLNLPQTADIIVERCKSAKMKLQFHLFTTLRFINSHDSTSNFIRPNHRNQATLQRCGLSRVSVSTEVTLKEHFDFVLFYQRKIAITSLSVKVESRENWKFFTLKFEQFSLFVIIDLLVVELNVQKNG